MRGVMSTAPPKKICGLCGEDCSNRPRIKDPKGRYYCKACHELALARREAVNATASPPSEPSPERQPEGDEHLAIMGELAEQVALPPVQGTPCPGCGQTLEVGAVLCTNCGYQTATGRHLEAKTIKAKRETSGETGGLVGFLMSPPGVALGALIFFGIFYFQARSDESIAAAYLLVEGLFSLAVGVTVLVLAFREGIGTGLLTLCLPFYALYFVFAVCENQYVRVLFPLSILASVAGFFLDSPFAYNSR